MNIRVLSASQVVVETPNGDIFVRLDSTGRGVVTTVTLLPGETTIVTALPGTSEKRELKMGYGEALSTPPLHLEYRNPDDGEWNRELPDGRQWRTNFRFFPAPTLGEIRSAYPDLTLRVIDSEGNLIVKPFAVVDLVHEA